MHRLEQLALELQSNPNAIKSIEQEVEMLVQSDSCAPLANLLASTVPAVHIFLCRALEMRVKRKAGSAGLEEEIQLSTRLVLEKPSFQACEVFSLLGLFCWPAMMPSFVDGIVSLLHTETGYQILLSFLEKINTSTAIDDKRRAELKRAISLIYSHIESNYSEEFAPFIIKIFTELLKILPKTFDFTMVYRKARECPDETISFIIEGVAYMDPNRIAQLLPVLPPDAGLIQTLTSLKTTRIEDVNTVYKYVFDALQEGPEYLVVAMDFWHRIFSARTNEMLLEPVITEILKSYLTVSEDSREEADQHIFGLFTVVCKHYPKQIAQFLKANGDHLPTRITSGFVQRLAKSEDAHVLHSLCFANRYLNCLVSYLRNDPATPEMIFSLSFTDKDEVKLGLMLLEKYAYSSEQLLYVLKMCENACLNANEIKVECYMKLGMPEKFGTSWDMNDVIRYFYYLKHSPEQYKKYRDYFYSLFISNAPFDRCFSIVEKLGTPPDQILKAVYDKLDRYPYIELCCFNNDLLAYLDNPRPYIEKEVARFVTEWNTISSHKEYYQALRSLLAIFTAKIDAIPIADSLVDLFQIDSCIVLNKALPIFNNYKGPCNVNKAVYYLICAYNLPNVTDSHTLISGSLAECMMRKEGPVAFHSILGIDINRCCEIQQQMVKLNKKTGQNMVRDLIKDFKGKPFSKMFANENKVTKQDFLPPKSKPEDNCNLKDFC